MGPAWRAPRCRGRAKARLAVSAHVEGLNANTTYHFRFSATNAGGTGEGSDETFKALPNSPTVETGVSVFAEADLGDVERDGEPQRRGGQRLPL